MENNSKTNFILPSKYVETSCKTVVTTISSSLVENLKYKDTTINDTTNLHIRIDSAIERLAQWFLSVSSMSNKKLQKLCYYAYCWYIVFYNDIELITKENMGDIRVLCSEPFQAWIHGPVSPQLYKRYKNYGWHEIPKVTTKPVVGKELESLFQQVWEAYGSFSADELEAISHNEMPWKNARQGISSGDACSNIISTYDILQYYSQLGKG